MKTMDGHQTTTGGDRLCQITRTLNSDPHNLIYFYTIWSTWTLEHFAQVVQAQAVQGLLSFVHTYRIYNALYNF